MSFDYESFNDKKRKILDKRFSRMNEMQREAVFTVNGPLLILAGAGSGKTTVLVNRIANMLNFGNAYMNNFVSQEASDDDYTYLSSIESLSPDEYDADDLARALHAVPVNPWNILAITFTNKASNELKERLNKLLGESGYSVNAGTFHSSCLKILRREISNLGYTSSFTIYDTDDSQRVIKDCIQELGINDKMFPPKQVLGEISRSKDKLIEPEQYMLENGNDFRKQNIAKIYNLYQKKLKSSNAVDFDDIICLTVKLFTQFPDVLDHYQNLYRYILVDEYQDTNHAQFKLVSMLADKYRNLCVVGDDDQSIYKFRGATIENILNFEKEYDNAKVIRLEQNYRSTQTILDAANEVIKNNKGRKGKSLWTENGKGEQVFSYRAQNETKESLFVTEKIEENVASGAKFHEHAVLYRMNSLSANIERALVQAGIPYRIVGGTKFFDRKEIKDVLSYFHLLENPHDSVRLKRIINEPKRGIGDATVKKVEAMADSLGISMLEVMGNATLYSSISSKATPLLLFSRMIEDLTEMSISMTLDELLDEVLEKTGYLDFLKSQGKEGEARIENVQELKSLLIKYHNDNEEGDLGGFLEEVSLYTDLDNMNDDDDKVTLMTMHAAKGLEFKYVFIVGMEENIFPSYLSLTEPEEMEEERRLAYVAITRAKEKLYIANSAERMLFGRTSRNRPSRFLEEIPKELLQVKDDTIREFSRNVMAERPAVQRRPEIGRSVGVSGNQQVTIDYTVGDRVYHKIFGEGVVKSMQKMANDTLVEVLFEKAGSKKIMANFAKLKKL